MKDAYPKRKGRLEGGVSIKKGDEMEKLVCDRCGVTYTDDESIQWAKREFESWKALCQRDGHAPRGICPCPVLPCPGELILKT